MKGRSVIQAKIINAWQQCIEGDYCNQRINSERSLQASFWSHINDSLPTSRRLFIEPSMMIRTPSGIKKLIPDIVICNTKEVISVIELKYLPRTQPRYKKDIESLAAIAQYRKGISISNSRFRGSEQDTTVYSLSDKVLFVWAGVHTEEKSNQGTLYSTGHRSLENCYMQLHAITQKNGDPEIILRK